MDHPLDLNYQSLKAKLTHVKEEEEEYDIIQKYLAATGRSVQILDVFRVDREGEVSGLPVRWIPPQLLLALCYRKRGLVLTMHWRTVVFCGTEQMWQWWLPSSSLV